jgi:hypothetical protein
MTSSAELLIALPGHRDHTVTLVHLPQRCSLEIQSLTPDEELTLVRSTARPLALRGIGIGRTPTDISKLVQNPPQTMINV